MLLFGDFSAGGTPRSRFPHILVRYQKANYTDSTNFGGVFVKAGLQYQLVLSGDMNLKFGATFGLPFIGDRVVLRVQVEGIRQDPAP